MKLSSKISNATELFTKLQGVGERSALRHVLSLTKWSREDLEEFGMAIQALSELEHCIECGIFSEQKKCHICLSQQRVEKKEICVVEEISDCLAIENSGRFSGVYFILGGVLNPLAGIGPSELKIEKLIQRISQEEMKNVILALNPSVEGDATASYIKEELPKETFVERIGFGIPMGGSLEYLDAMTITKALENKREM